METNFANNLQIALIENEMTQNDLAGAIGTTQPTVNRWIKGINQPDFETLLDICCIIHETPNYLLGYDENTEDKFMEYYQEKDTKNTFLERYYKANEEDFENYKKNDNKNNLK